MSWQFPLEGSDTQTRGRKRKASVLQMQRQPGMPPTSWDDAPTRDAARKPQQEDAIIINPLMVCDFEEAGSTDGAQECLRDTVDEEGADDWGYLQAVTPTVTVTPIRPKRCTTLRTSDTPWHRFVAREMPLWRDKGLASRDVMRELGKAWRAAQKARVS